MPCCRPKTSPSLDHPAVAARRHELLRPVAPAPTPPRAGFAQLQGSVSPVLPLSPSFSDAGAVHRVPTALGPAPRHGPPPPLNTPPLPSHDRCDLPPVRAHRGPASVPQPPLPATAPPPWPAPHYDPGWPRCAFGRPSVDLGERRIGLAPSARRPHPFGPWGL